MEWQLCITRVRYGGHLDIGMFNHQALPVQLHHLNQGWSTLEPQSFWDYLGLVVRFICIYQTPTLVPVYRCDYSVV